MLISSTVALEGLPDFPALESVRHLHIFGNANLSNIDGLDIGGWDVVCGNDGEESSHALVIPREREGEGRVVRRPPSPGAAHEPRRNDGSPGLRRIGLRL